MPDRTLGVNSGSIEQLSLDRTLQVGLDRPSLGSMDPGRARWVWSRLDRSSGSGPGSIGLAGLDRSGSRLIGPGRA